jgi:hypothetical protein
MGREFWVTMLTVFLAVVLANKYGNKISAILPDIP